MARVRLHTGNPTRDTTPPWGARDVLGSNPEFVRGKPRPQAVPKCGWCGAGIKTGKTDTPAYCSRCRAHHQTIQAAKDYLAQHALRPLGGSDASESATELGHRRAALGAQKTLNSIKKSSKGTTGKAATKAPKKAMSKQSKAKKNRKAAETPGAREARLAAEVVKLTDTIVAELSSPKPLTPERALRIKRLKTQKHNLLRGIAQRRAQAPKMQ